MYTLLDTALSYHHAGLVVLPNHPDQKYPAGLKQWQSVTPSEADVRRWFGSVGQHAIGVRDVEGLDFDNKGNPDAKALYHAWHDLMEQLAPGLADRLLCEQTPSGGYHLVWPCEEIAGNQKLATRPPTPAELATSPKLTAITLIETRGRGGQFQVAPSPGYTLLRGDWTALPAIAPAERQIVLDCARALSQADSRAISLRPKTTDPRPGDAYNEHHAAAAFALLEAAGWAVISERDGVRYLCRPGKERGVSASWGHVAPNVLYVFSSNADPFQSGKAYSPFAIYTELEHGGDYKRAAGALREQTKAEPPTRVKPRISLRTGEILDDSQPREYVVRPEGLTAAQLYHTEFAPLYWTVENIMPEGAVLLAGKPKSRKSWGALDCAASCAGGAKLFGKLDTRQGRVLYLDLESNQRRMRGRLFSMIGQDMEKMDNLHIFTEWPRGEEGITAIDQWMLAYPDTVLVVIDVLADFRRGKDPKEDAYQYDRETVKPINACAERHRMSILLVHHTRKMKADDVFDEVSGSTGLISAVATTWIIGRNPNGENETILTLRGRDLLDDDPLALEWDDYDNRFKVIGVAADAALTTERRAVLTVMDDDAAWEPKGIATELQKPVGNVKKMLRALLAEGFIVRIGHGKYVRVLKRGTFGTFGNFGNYGTFGTDSETTKGTKGTGDIGGGTFQNHFSQPLPERVNPTFESERYQSELNSKDNAQPDKNLINTATNGNEANQAPMRSYSYDGISRNGGEVWRVWEDVSNTVLHEYPTEAEARTEAERLSGDASI